MSYLHDSTALQDGNLVKVEQGMNRMCYHDYSAVTERIRMTFEFWYRFLCPGYNAVNQHTYIHTHGTNDWNEKQRNGIEKNEYPGHERYVPTRQLIQDQSLAFLQHRSR